jgi:hypothetical protein
MKKIWMMKNVMPMRQLMTLFALLVVVAMQGANVGKHVNVSLRHDNIPVEQAQQYFSQWTKTNDRVTFTLVNDETDELKSFTVTCGPHTKRIPRDIRLLVTTSDQLYSPWKEIYFEKDFNNRLPARNGASVVCEIPADKQGQYLNYRFECSGNPIDYSLAELTLNFE